MIGQVCLWMVLLVLFGTTATFIRLVSLFIADVASFLEALVLTFLVLAFISQGSLLSLQTLESRRFPFESSITFSLASYTPLLRFSVVLLNPKPHNEIFQL